jgi:hypothetical protein
MRKLAISSAAIAVALVLTAALALYLWRLSPFLPKRGGTACFTASYDPPRPIDLSSPRRDRKSVGEVRAIKLRITFPSGEKPFRDERSGRGYDWRYDLRLDAALANGDRLSTGAYCEASDGFVDRIMPALFCDIDCDGGTVTIWRRIGQNGVSLRFEAGERLRMSNGCGAPGAIFIGADQEARSLAAETASPQQCEGE